MELREYVEEQFAYNRQANELYIDTLEKASIEDEEAIKQLSHVLDAHAVWNARVLGDQPAYKVWENHSISKMKEINEWNHRETERIIELFDRNTPVEYANSKGEEYTNRLWEILNHIVNHSTHHRAKVAAVLAKHNITPPVSDYIAMRRTAS